MRALLVIIFLLGLWSRLFSQEKLIKGQIIIDTENESAEGIYITNKRTQISTITDLTGSFAIHAKEGDELLIQSFLYESRKFIIIKNVLDNGFVSIHLNLQPIVLDAAIITPKLTGYLDKDVKYQASKDIIAKLYRDLGINPDNGKIKDSTALKSWNEYHPFTLNIEGIFGAITGDTRRKRNLYEYEGKEERISNLRNYFGDEYFENDLKIPKEKIRDFLFYSYETGTVSMYYERGDYLNIMVELNKSSKVYLNRLNSWHKGDIRKEIENSYTQ